IPIFNFSCAEILKGADLSKVTSKVVRKQVEEKLGVDLSHRRKEIDALIMADVEDQVSSEEVSEEEDKAAKDDDYAPGAAKKAKKGKAKKRKADSDEEDSDEDWAKKKKKASAPAAGGGRKKSAFTKSFRLSPELADVVGAEIMPRHEVVKKLWAVIKERNLQDPKQKQFAICDAQLMKVFGVKRFRAFGMMSYLKNHFVEAV
ncbi:upstream activation factor subunit spp27, partial [Hyalella azteca]|uniref:Upstream activation factor subunit spp27 n=1 Tax=Hyalella azteca TaxID=294128 RepID=A0A8B7NR77_HYAAZ